MLRSSTWTSISANPQVIDYTHCVPDSKLLNFFPTKGGISDTLSPRTIMSGEILDYKKHLSLQIGQYCQVHEEDAPRKSQNTRHDGFWDQSIRNSTLCWEEIQHFNVWNTMCIVNNLGIR